MELNSGLPRASLSITDRRVGALVATGHADAVIAHRLLLTAAAVEWSVAKLCRALGADSREELAARLAAQPAG